MSDWRNILPMIVNKIRYQLFAKKMGNLERVRQIMQVSLPLLYPSKRT